jgi:DNA polymerase-3 subunit alpha
MYFIFDTETTGLPQNYNAPVSDSENWPRLVQVAWQVHDAKGDLVEVKNFIVKPDGFDIPFAVAKIHGITTERANQEGVELSFVLEEFNKSVKQAQFIIGHNIEFDNNIMGAEFYRLSVETPLLDLPVLDTKNLGTEYCAIPGGRGGRFKWPTLTELHTKLFGEAFGEAHNASADVEATARCFLELVRLSVIGIKEAGLSQDDFKAFAENNPKTIELVGLNIEAYKPMDQETSSSAPEPDAQSPTKKSGSKVDLTDAPFAHLHVHSAYSVLQATTEVKTLVATAKEMGMPAVALTDHSNMYGVFLFVREALAAGIKPIVGCELNLCTDLNDKKNKDNGNQQVLIAKNKKGYHNLSKLCSMSFTDGFYYVPRIDKNVLLELKGDLIATTGGVFGEIPNLILNVGTNQAEEAFVWWKENFGDDFYVELNRHGVEEEDHVNEVLLQFAKKYDVKVIAANNTYYTVKEDATAQDILLCVKDGKSLNQPKKFIGRRGREFRYGLPNNEFYLKTPQEMKKLFADIPESITNISELIDKVEEYPLKRDVLLPKFDIPEGFDGEDDYLRHLTYEGAKKRYPELTPEITERLDFELETIKKTGYPGYFLIVQDFTSQARKMGVSVGPGRGSAAGSAVAYCTAITNVDPIKYDLLFERFLNPDRVSLPDIDIDFDDEGRGRIIDWVVEKYGKHQVAQIITYGTMAAKSAIRDTARAMDLPLPDADRIAKLVPDTSLAKIFGMDTEALREKLGADQMALAEQLIAISKSTQLDGVTLQQAIKLEGSVRNTGTHACGVIITPSDIREHIPITISKDSDLYVTQYDNSVVESAGMLKMDFLGLKTLTIIKDAIAIIKMRHGVEIDPDTIPLDDPKTYELYQKGETNGTFQFESEGMQKHLKALKPDKFGDLIAMNALYRPGPIEYIPNFIARKNGDEDIVFDIPDMEEYLAETYGITVYQEQVMLLSQKLAGFTKGEADVLRKAMGKKIFKLLEELKPKFLNGCKERGHDVKMAEKVWKDWEAFAAYAFNKSHSTCYSIVAFHTAYLKANYPAEYMASVMTHNMNDMKKITFFMDECKRAGIPVLGPDINESTYKFVVNDNGEIRFGLGAIRGVGEGAVESIVDERTKNGPFRSIFDVTKRIDLRAANKKTMEGMAYGGGFDSFKSVHRAQYFFAHPNEGQTLIERAIKFGSRYQEQLNSNQQSLFGGGAEVEMPDPAIHDCPEWHSLDQLNKEKDVIGIYLSGHPLDPYRMEMEHFCTCNCPDYESYLNRTICVAGMITEVAIRRSNRDNNEFGLFTIEDYKGPLKMALFGEQFLKFRHFLEVGKLLFFTGRVETRGKWSDLIELKLDKIDLLSEVREKRLAGIEVELDLKEISNTLISDLGELIEAHPGECGLKFKIWESDKMVSVNLASHKGKINPGEEFLQGLERIGLKSYRFNKS